MEKAQTSFGPIQAGILLLALATGLIHFTLAIPDRLIMFYLNGIAYVVLAVALFLPQFKSYRTWIRYALMALTLITIIAWVAIGMRTPLGYIDKIIEVALLALLWMDRGR
ncbi:MAG TPA: hypothetical protein VN363_03835 [Anaerolineales bacterium]|nr:hypothetical protein [Anaerolineales bacterium]